MTSVPVPERTQVLEKLFMHHLSRIYNGKCFLRDRLPELMPLTSFNDLKLAIEEFAEGVYKQIRRLEDVYALIGEKPADDGNNPIKNIVQDKFFQQIGQDQAAIRDLDLMLYVQLLEHVNITSFRMLILISKELELQNVTQLLMENFDESRDNDKLFTLIANEHIARA